uniref:Uncharacterized protein n=1 Tax=Macaca nemestrina TaxID=9545 RepID=A0A2K6DAQ0_MACNE
MHSAAKLDSTAPETATPTWGAADTRVEAAFQEKERKRKRRASGKQGPRPPPTRPAACSSPAQGSRPQPSAIGRSQVAQASDSAAGPARPGALRCVPRPRRRRRH